MAREESFCCIVVFYHHEWQEAAFHVYTGLLFGLPLAVTSFNRWSCFAEAMSRRLLMVLASMYFGDLRITDRASSKGSAQWSINALNATLGTPFPETPSHVNGWRFSKPRT